MFDVRVTGRGSVPPSADGGSPQPSSQASLQHVLDRPDTWRGCSSKRAYPTLPTTSTELDRLIGGIPVGALTEIICQRYGLGELSLLLPALKTSMSDGRSLMLVNPPFVIYGPELARCGLPLRQVSVIQGVDEAQQAWVVEQALRSGACGGVMLWTDRVSFAWSRRFQLAAEQGRACGILFHLDAGRSDQHSTAVLRLKLAAEVQLRGETKGRARLWVRILKQRGNLRTPELLIPMP